MTTILERLAETYVHFLKSNDALNNNDFTKFFWTLKPNMRKVAIQTLSAMAGTLRNEVLRSCKHDNAEFPYGDRSTEQCKDCLATRHCTEDQFHMSREWSEWSI